MRVAEAATHPAIHRAINRAIHCAIHRVIHCVTPALGGGDAHAMGPKPLDGMSVWAAVVDAATASPRTEVLHLIDPMGNSELLKTNGKLAWPCPSRSLPTCHVIDL